MKNLIAVATRLEELRQTYPTVHDARITRAVVTATSTLESALSVAEEAVRKHTESLASVAGLSGLPGLVDLSAPAVTASVTYPTAHVGGDTVVSVEDVEDNDDDYDDDDYDDYEPGPSADLKVTVASTTGAVITDDIVTKALEHESLAGAVGYYTVQDGSIVNGEATLVAEPGAGVPDGTLPAATVIFTGMLDDPAVTVTIAVAGEEDPESPALNPTDRLAQVIAERAEFEFGLPVEDVYEIRMVLTSLDTDELTIEQATNTVLPRAMAALEMQLGAHEVIEVIDGQTPAVKVGRLRPAGEGALDRRVLTTGIAQFRGTLPFPGIGRVSASASVA